MPDLNKSMSQSKLVCCLRKALYDLKQGARVWNKNLSARLIQMGFKPLTANHSVSIRGNIIIVIYVDDLLLVGPNLDNLNTIKMELSQSFQMSDLGASTFYLGMSVTRDREAQVLSLSQETYIKKILWSSRMQDCKPVSTPMEANNRLEKAKPGYKATPKFRTKYQSIVGSLMYAMLGTRPDIAFAVSIVSRYGSNPTPAHYGVVKRILRYLKGSSHLKLVYRGDLKPLTEYTDSDWAGDHDTRRSTSGCFQRWKWCSKLVIEATTNGGTVNLRSRVRRTNPSC